ncbi:hypothetical protein [Mesobacillus harenae]|uniref:hypothetical protein n=1 Tax=Mesobacillus harenae TaxID=2213203 RepID=UPI001580CC48|nr:hypothetical protein [Mesobacillus harenae]
MVIWMWIVGPFIAFILVEEIIHLLWARYVLGPRAREYRAKRIIHTVKDKFQKYRRDPSI